MNIKITEPPKTCDNCKFLKIARGQLEHYSCYRVHLMCHDKLIEDFFNYGEEDEIKEHAKRHVCNNWSK